MTVTAGALSLLALSAPQTPMRYRIAGEDVYRIGTAADVTRISYSGLETLSFALSGKSAELVAQANCTRSDSAGKSAEQARFVQEILPDGSLADRVDDDPDFLTILNQPFSIRLDAATIRDLRELRAPVPFAAASPVGSGDLEGSLRPGTPGIIEGRRVVGVEFQADGKVRGPLPVHSARIDGRIHLDGTAYYDATQALLLALDARLTIDGVLTGSGLGAVPVHITYDRVIRVL